MHAKDIYAGGSYIEKRRGNSSSLTVRTVNSIVDEIVHWSGQTAYWSIISGKLETYTHSGSVHIDCFARDVKDALALATTPSHEANPSR